MEFRIKVTFHLNLTFPQAPLEADSFSLMKVPYPNIGGPQVVSPRLRIFSETEAMQLTLPRLIHFRVMVTSQLSRVISGDSGPSL